MIFDLLGHLGDIDAETEIKYLLTIPFNGIHSFLFQVMSVIVQN